MRYPVLGGFPDRKTGADTRHHINDYVPTVTNMPFSIVVPVHNKQAHISRAIDSVLAQTHDEFELLLVDDASTDGSAEEIQKFQDARIRLFRRDTPGAGGYAARNLAIQHATYDWIVFLDADDDWEPIKLEKTKGVIEMYPEAAIITNRWRWVDSDRSVERNVFKKGFDKKGYVTPFLLSDFLFNQDLMWTGAIAVRKDVIMKAGLFPSDPRCRKGGDLDTWIRSLTISKLNLYIDEVLSNYYRDTENRVTDYKNNPTTHFCAYDTVMDIYRTSQDNRLRTSLRYFINKNLFLMIIKQVQAGRKIDRSLVAKFHATPHTLYYIARIYAEYGKVFLRSISNRS